MHLNLRSLECEKIFQIYVAIVAITAGWHISHVPNTKMEVYYLEEDMHSYTYTSCHHMYCNVEGVGDPISCILRLCLMHQVNILSHLICEKKTGHI